MGIFDWLFGGKSDVERDQKRVGNQMTREQFFQKHPHLKDIIKPEYYHIHFPNDIRISSKPGKFSPKHIIKDPKVRESLKQKSKDYKGGFKKKSDDSTVTD